MDSLFKCKCGKPMTYSNEPCKFCGSLGPHIYMGKSGSDVDATPDKTHRRRTSSFTNGTDRKPPAQPGGDQFRVTESAAHVEPPLHLSHSAKEEMEAPVSIYPRSPILDDIDKMDSYERKESKKRHSKDDDLEYADKSSDKYDSSYVEEEDERPQKSNTGSVITTAIGVVLVLLLIMTAIYVINNFETVTKWLAAPTVPEFFKPSGTSSSDIQSPQSFGGFLSNFFAGTTSAKNAIPVTEKPLPVISEATIDSITEYSARIKWKTNEPCTSKVLYKTDVGEILDNNKGDKLDTDHDVLLTNLRSGTNYYLTLRSWNSAGIESKPVEKSFPTLAAAKDIIPPQLLGQPSVVVSDSTATVTWKTDEKSTSLVKYGPGTGYEFSSEEKSENAVEHSIFITALSAGATYHFQVLSADSAGNVMKSSDYQFKTEAPSESSPYLGGRAPGFTLKTLDGNEVSLSQYKGKKIVLNFWASWCSPCKIETPHFQAFWDKYRDSNDVMLLTVAGSDSDLNVLKSIISSSGYNFIVCLDASEDVFNRYEISSIPKTYFMDKSGIIRRIQQGMFTGLGEIEFMLNSF